MPWKDICCMFSEVKKFGVKTLLWFIPFRWLFRETASVWTAISIKNYKKQTRDENNGLAKQTFLVWFQKYFVWYMMKYYI